MRSVTATRPARPLRGVICAAAAAVLTILAPAGPAADEHGGDKQAFIRATCATIETEARRRSLPPGYFARLIWKESRFDPGAVSPKGASGIAQFMPRTARDRGLADPFDPETALAASAAYLQDLARAFGNLGLAAAAYNAGPDRVARWRTGSTVLPRETRDFVLTITGLTPEQWRAPDVATPDFALHETLPFAEACRKFASAARPMTRGSAEARTWGVLIASHFTETRAHAALERLRAEYALVAAHEPVDIARRPNPARGGRRMYEITLGVDGRSAGNALCARLRRAGGACMVVKK